MHHFRHCLLIVFVITIPVVGQEPSPLGAWKWSANFAGQTVRSELEIARDGSKLVGHYKDQNIDQNVENVKLDNGKISFDMNVDSQGTKMKFVFLGRLTSQAIDGTVGLTINGQDLGAEPWQASRFVERKHILGTWDLDYTAPDGRRYRPVLSITGDGIEKRVGDEGQTLEAAMSRDGKNYVVKSIEIDDASFRLVASHAYEGSPIQLAYICEPRGNALAGTLEYELDGETGAFPISATRRVLPANEKALLGTWIFEVPGPDGVNRKTKLVLEDAGGKLQVGLSGDGREFKPKDVRIQGKELTFAFTNSHDGLKVQLEWSSRLTKPDQMSGALSYDAGGNVGEIPITGQRSK